MTHSLAGAWDVLLHLVILLKAPDHRKSSPNSDTAGVACCPAIHFQLYWGNRNITKAAERRVKSENINYTHSDCGLEKNTNPKLTWSSCDPYQCLCTRQTPPSSNLHNKSRHFSKVFSHLLTIRLLVYRLVR